ncbi:MAG: AAA family ATPase [Thermodesulfobacteriota bacterium]
MTQEVGSKVWSLGQFLREPIHPPPSLLSPWLRAGNQWLVYAEAGLGKTFFALNVAYAVASGGAFLNWTAPAPHSVLYVDGEMETWEMQARLRGIHKAAARDGIGNLEEAGRHFHGYCATYQEPGKAFPDLATQEGLAVLLEKAKRKALVVIDNLTTTMRSGDENEAAYWTAMSEALLELRKRGTAVLLVHHENKSGDQRGTSAKDVTLNGKIRLARPVDHAEASGASFVIQWPKARGLTGPDRAQVQATLTQGDASLPRWEHIVFDASRHQELVRLAKSGEYSTQAQIAQAMDVAPSYVTKLKTEAIGFGLFTSHQFQAWLRTAGELQRLEAEPEF